MRKMAISNNRAFLMAILAVVLFTACDSQPADNQGDTAAVDTTATTAGKPYLRDTIIGPTGPEMPKVFNQGGKVYYIYPDYTAVVSSEEMEEGYYTERVKLVRPGTTDTLDFGGGEMQFFGGMAGNYILVDEGTLDIARTMRVYDATSGRNVGSFDYDDSELALQDGRITFWAILDDAAAEAVHPKPDCPEEADIKASGLGLVWAEKRAFDLRTGRVTPLKEYKCKAVS